MKPNKPKRRHRQREDVRTSEPAGELPKNIILDPVTVGACLHPMSAAEVAALPAASDLIALSRYLIETLGMTEIMLRAEKYGPIVYATLKADNPEIDAIYDAARRGDMSALGALATDAGRRRREQTQRYHVPPSNCPHCAAKLTTSILSDDDHSLAPEPGDVLVCIECAGVVVLADDLTARAPTSEENQGFAGDRDLLAAQDEMRRFIAYKKARQN